MKDNESIREPRWPLVVGLGILVIAIIVAALSFFDIASAQTKDDRAQRGLGPCYRAGPVAAGMENSFGQTLVAGRIKSKFCVTLPGTRLANIYWKSDVHTDTYVSPLGWLWNASAEVLNKGRSCVRWDNGLCKAYEWHARWEFKAHFPIDPVGVKRDEIWRTSIRCNAQPKCFYDRERLD